MRARSEKSFQRIEELGLSGDIPRKLPFFAERDIPYARAHKLPYHLRESVGKDESIIKILKRTPYKRANCDNKNCQKIVEEHELAEYLENGWKVQAVLQSGKIIVSNE